MTEQLHFLGFEITTTRKNGILESLRISKAQYIKEMKKYLREKESRGSTPISPNFYFKPEDYSPLEMTSKEHARNVKRLQIMVGILMYISVTCRPDISYSVQYLARFSKYPHDVIFNKVRQVISYLMKTSDFGIEYQRDYRNPDRVEVYVNSDYSSDPIDRKSQNGFLSMRMGAPISWKSEKTTLTTQSSAESEYMALVLASNETRWLMQAIRFLKGPDKHPPLFYVDSLSAIKLAQNPVFHARTKHLDEKLHLIRDRLRDKEIEVQYLKGEQQVADLLTKPVQANVLKRLRPQILV